MRIGFAGLGAIGRPMAARLAANHDLTVWNRTGSVAEAFAATHEVAVAPTPRELAEGSEVLFTCLPSSREVVALLDGPRVPRQFRRHERRLEPVLPDGQSSV